MADSIEILSEGLAKLELTVAQGIHDSEQRDLALSQKIDVTTESLRADIRTVAETIGALADEFRRTTESIRKEHAADRKILTVTLRQHARRLKDLETE